MPNPVVGSRLTLGGMKAVIFVAIVVSARFCLNEEEGRGKELRLLGCEWLQPKSYEQRTLMLFRPIPPEEYVPRGGFHIGEGRT